jgi:hypothetical protein
MRGRSLCFFHTRVATKPNPRPTRMPTLEDGNAIQLGIAEVIRRVLCYDIEYKAAYCLLQAYKLALWNLKNVRIDPYEKDVVTVDPASDPENAGAATEPLTHHQLRALENPEPETDNTDAEPPTEKDEETTFKEFLLSQLIDPDSPNESAPQEGAPSNRSGFERLVGDNENADVTANLSSRAKRDLAVDSVSESEGRHYLAQQVTARKAGSAQSPEGTAQRKDVQRIVIPKELSEAINNEDEPEMTEEQFMRLTSALFSTKTG